MRLGGFLDELNAAYGDEIASAFVITIGDEFQGLLRSAMAATDLLWRAYRAFPDPRVRLGFGWGEIHTQIRREAVGMDGPAFHHARGAIDLAKAGSTHGGVFVGFGWQADVGLTGLARTLEALRDAMTTKQSDTVDLLRRGLAQVQAAHQLGVTPQAIHNRCRGARWDAYQTGENALTLQLATFRGGAARSLGADAWREFLPTGASELVSSLVQRSLQASP